MSRILFVAPRWDSDRPANAQAPLTLATLAALTPPEHETEIWDENLRGEIDERIDFGKKYDLVGLTGYESHLPRAIEVAGLMRKQGLTVVIGGCGVSSTPDVCRGKFDVLFLGEAELTWPRFLAEWQQGKHHAEYRQVDRIDMSLSPVPKWDSIAKDVGRYVAVGVQTTRGCPFDCEFCDVIALYGRKPRHKPIDNIVKEIRDLERLGVRKIFFCDDDFVGDPKWVKQLLRALVPLNNSFKVPLVFTTQADTSAARDEELLELLADCNFSILHIGFETPRAASLKEAHKHQNLRLNLVEACHKIQSYGIGVRALLLCGFDSDDVNIFQEQWEFMETARPIGVSINVMKAPPGTPLWTRLQRENRVLDMSDFARLSVRAVSDIIPKQMTRIELLEGYRWLLDQAHTFQTLERRLMQFVDGVRRVPKVKRAPRGHRLWSALKNLVKTVEKRDKFPPEMRRMMFRVIRYAHRTKPEMVDRVKALILQPSVEILVQPHERIVIQKQIDLARAGNQKLNHDPSAGNIPPDFRRKLRDVLPWVYESLAGGITYRPAIPVAMLAVVKDFVIRWGGSFQDFEPHHRTYLAELCSRHTDRWLAEQERRGTAARTSSDPGMTREQLTSPQFVQALLAGVEQDLRTESKEAVFKILTA